MFQGASAAQLGAHPGGREVAELLRDSFASVREGAAVALRHMGPRAAAELAEQLTAPPSPATHVLWITLKV